MNYPYQWTQGGSLPVESLLAECAAHREAGRRIITTNGCFDLLHVGHLQFLSQARTYGDLLIVGVNSDASVRRLKGCGRPIVPEVERAALLAALRPVDRVIVFDDLLPSELLALIRPDIHCKAGDYTADGLPEAQIVCCNGGEVRILPLADGYSSSRLVQQILSNSQSVETIASMPLQMGDATSRVMEQLLASGNVLRQTAYHLSAQIVHTAEILVDVLSVGRKVLLCGNGGSAADAQHFAAELVGRFRRERSALPALALSTDTSVLTALGNDYGFEQIFARQLTAFGQQGDMLIAISTSGASRNILAAMDIARSNGLRVIGLTGAQPPPTFTTADLCLSVPSTNTAYIQQAHSAILHCICGVVEEMLFDEVGDNDTSGRVS